MGIESKRPCSKENPTVMLACVASLASTGILQGILSVVSRMAPNTISESYDSRKTAAMSGSKLNCKAPRLPKGRLKLAGAANRSRSSS